MKVVDFFISAGISSIRNYTETTRIYRVCENLFSRAVNLMYSKNELTEQRNFSFIPTSLLNDIGGKVYLSLCPPDGVLQRKTCNLEDEQLIQDVEDVFAKLVAEIKKKYPSAKKMPWEISIKKDSSINSFSLPGGKIAITTGILDLFKEKPNRKDFIASVLSHEIAHVLAGHKEQQIQFSIFAKMVVKGSAHISSALCVPETKIDPQGEEEENKKKLQAAEKQREGIHKSFEKAAQIPINLLLDTYSQDNELEADKFGIEIAYEAGFNPKATIDLQQIYLEFKGKEAEFKGKEAEFKEKEVEFKEKEVEFKEKEEHQKKLCFAKVFDLISSHPPSEKRLKASKEIVERIASHLL